MRFGFALPQVGSEAGPEALVMVAKRAEDLGFDSAFLDSNGLLPKREKEKIKERPFWTVDLKCLATFPNLFSISDSPALMNRRLGQARKNDQL